MGYKNYFTVREILDKFSLISRRNHLKWVTHFSFTRVLFRSKMWVTNAKWVTV